MKFPRSLLLLVVVLIPLRAYAIFSCEGTLDKDNFADERSSAQAELQKTILEYRRLEGSNDSSDKSKLGEVKERLDKQKKKFQGLDSKYFPRTPVTAFGAACNDKRWLEEAKSKLVEKPELLGKHWYVWLDKSSREPKAAIKRPPFETMAE